RVLPGTVRLRLLRHAARVPSGRSGRLRPGRGRPAVQHHVRPGFRARLLRGVRPRAATGFTRTGRAGGRRRLRVRAMAVDAVAPLERPVHRWDSPEPGDARTRARLLAATRLPAGTRPAGLGAGRLADGRLADDSRLRHRTAVRLRARPARTGLDRLV